MDITSATSDRGPAWDGDTWVSRDVVLDGSSDFRHGFDATFTRLHWPLAVLANHLVSISSCNVGRLGAAVDSHV